MTEHATNAAQAETAFLAGVEANLQDARGTVLAGAIWKSRHGSDELELRHRLESLGKGRADLKALPKNKHYVLSGFRRRFLFGAKQVSAAIASVLSPVDHYLTSDSPAPPIGADALREHIRVMAAPHRAPTLVGVCSPSGFTDDARRSPVNLPNVDVVLIEPRPGGGWRLQAIGDVVGPDTLKLFDPETGGDKLRRVQACIDARGADLLTGGLSAERIGRELHLPLDVVVAAFEQRVSDDAELRVTREEQDVLLFRGATAEKEDSHMSIGDRFKKLFKKGEDHTATINALSERRAKLDQRRQRVYEDVTHLELREQQMIEHGKQATTQSMKVRYASQIKSVRDDLKRSHAMAKMLGQQIDVINTDIHNLTLIQEGKSAQLPTTEQLTQHAVEAEEMLEQLAANTEIASGLGAGAGTEVELTSDEERAILAELDGPSASTEETAQRESAAPSSVAKEPKQSHPPEAAS